MNASDPLILYADASIRDFVSHTLSDQATRRGMMELELFAFVFSVKNFVPYLLGKFFTVRTNGSQESCVPLKFDRSQTGQMEGPPFGVPFSNERAHPWTSQRGS